MKRINVPSTPRFRAMATSWCFSSVIPNRDHAPFSLSDSLDPARLMGNMFLDLPLIFSLPLALLFSQFYFLPPLVYPLLVVETAMRLTTVDRFFTCRTAHFPVPDRRIFFLLLNPPFLRVISEGFSFCRLSFSLALSPFLLIHHRALFDDAVG